MVRPSNRFRIYRKAMEKCQAKCTPRPLKTGFRRFRVMQPSVRFNGICLRSVPARRMPFQRCRMPGRPRVQGLAGREAY